MCDFLTILTSGSAVTHLPAAGHEVSSCKRQLNLALTYPSNGNEEINAKIGVFI